MDEDPLLIKQDYTLKFNRMKASMQRCGCLQNKYSMRLMPTDNEVIVPIGYESVKYSDIESAIKEVQENQLTMAHVVKTKKELLFILKQQYMISLAKGHPHMDRKKFLIFDMSIEDINNIKEEMYDIGFNLTMYQLMMKMCVNKWKMVE
jgi:uncharacterized protein YxjI